jgi:hypothetical protein
MDEFSGMIEIKDYGYFKVVPDSPERPQGRIIYFETEDGVDWYETVRTLVTLDGETGAFIGSIHPTWALVDADGLITNVEYDPSRLVPRDRRVLGIDVPWKTIKRGTVYRDGTLIEEEPPAWMTEEMIP